MTAHCIFSSPEQSSGRAIAPPPASASALVLPLVWPLAKCKSFYVKDFYVMGKALTGELSCPVTGLVYVPSFIQIILDYVCIHEDIICTQKHMVMVPLHLQFLPFAKGKNWNVKVP